jgi:serine/threonine-protein kinase RsbT
MTVPSYIRIETEKDIVFARQTGRNLSKQLGFGNIVQSRIATAISELARNIFLYAGTGTITIEIVKDEKRIGLRITAEDQGPGIPDIRKAMEDGYSTSGALGAGLPGVKRMMDQFSIESTVGQGTKVVITKWLDSTERG